VLLPGVGHWTEQEAPGEVSRLMVEFLRSIDDAKNAPSKEKAAWCSGRQATANARPLPCCTLYALRDQHTPSGPNGPGKIDRRFLLAAKGCQRRPVGARTCRGRKLPSPKDGSQETRDAIAVLTYVHEAMVTSDKLSWPALEAARGDFEPRTICR
jgi:hypothetical protein